MASDYSGCSENAMAGVRTPSDGAGSFYQSTVERRAHAPSKAHVTIPVTANARRDNYH